MINSQCNIKLLEQGLDDLGLEVDKHQIAALLRHLELLQKWNRRLNLTAITDPQAMVVEHLLDSLSIAGYIDGCRVLDVGSGAGFPGLPLAVLFADKHFTLLDSRTKRIGFIQAVCQDIGLGNVEPVKQRIENYRAEVKFDTLTARAFSSLVNIYQWTRHLQHPGMQLLLMKGKYPGDELVQLQRKFEVTAEVVPLKVPKLKADRHLVLINC